MPMVAAAGIGLVGTIGSAMIGASAAKKAAKLQAAATDKASALQLKMYETAREDLKPYTATGKGAMDSIAALYGLPTAENPEGGEPMSDSALAGWEKTPDYKVTFDAGVKAVNQNDAAKGKLLSGAHYKALSDYAGDYANTRFNQYVERLYGLAGRGQNAAAGTGTAAMRTGDSVASNTMEGATAEASGIVGSANQWSSALGSVADMGGYLANRYGSSYAAAPAHPLYG